MKVTEGIIQVITDALRVKSPRITYEDMGSKLGKSKSWVSKLLSGDIKQVDEDLVEEIEKILGVKLQVMSLGVSGVAAQIDTAMKDNPTLSTAFVAMLEAQNVALNKLPFIPTEYLIEIGQAANRASHAYPDKDGKVGRIIVEKFAEVLNTMAENGQLSFKQ